MSYELHGEALVEASTCNNDPIEIVVAAAIVAMFFCKILGIVLE